MGKTPWEPILEEDLWRSVVAKLIARPAKGIDMARLRAELATHRQRLDEVAADYDVHSLLHISEHGGDRQYFYLARARSWSAEAGDRSGPEFTDPSRGEYHLQPIPFTAQALGGINLKPEALARFLLGHLRNGTDLFTLPDLRASQAARI